MIEDETIVETETTEPTDITDTPVISDTPDTVYMTDVLNYFTHDVPGESDSGVFSVLGGYIRDFVGEPPAGLEFLEYIVAACFFLLLFKFLTTIFSSLSKFMGGR